MKPTDRAMTKAVTRWLPAAEDRVQSQASIFGSYDVVFLFSPVTLIPPEPTHILLVQPFSQRQF